MSNSNGENQQNPDLSVGDRVMLNDKNVEGEIIGVREFDGKKTFVVHTEKGNRVVVGARQVTKL